MTEKIRKPKEVLAIPNHEIDRELENGLKCPHCGESDFNTTQLVYCYMAVSNGKWGNQDDGGDRETVSVECDSCGDIIWTQHEE